MNVVSRWTLSLGVLGCALVALGAGCQLAQPHQTSSETYTLVFGQKFTDREKLAEKLTLLIEGGSLGEPTDGSKENAKKVIAGEAAFGLGQSDLKADPPPEYGLPAEEKKLLLTAEELKTVHPIALFHGEYIQFYVSDAIWKQAQEKDENALETLRNWKINKVGPTIGTGKRGSGTKPTSKESLLSYFGFIPETNCYSGNQGYEEIIKLCKGGYADRKKLMDAYIFVSSPLSEVGRSLMGQNYHLISFDDSTLNSLVRQNPYWERGVIPKGAVSQKQMEEVRTISIDLMLFAGNNISWDVSEKLLSAITVSFNSGKFGYYTLVTNPNAPAFKLLDKQATAFLTSTPRRYLLPYLLIGLGVLAVISCSLLWRRYRQTSVTNAKPTAPFMPKQEGE